MNIKKRENITTTLLKETFKQMRELSVVYQLDNKNHIIERAIQNEVDRLKKEGLIK